MKVGLVTLHNCNYGSALQCYATQDVISRFGMECVLLDEKLPKSRAQAICRVLVNAGSRCLCAPQKVKHIYRILDAQRQKSLTISDASRAAIEDFNVRHIRQMQLSLKDLKKIGENSEYAWFFAGSDQVWNGAAIFNTSHYFLRFAPKQKRVAWAPSFGGNIVEAYNEREYKRNITEFEFLSAREMSGVKLIYEYTGKDARLLCDPVVLLSAAEWRKKAAVKEVDWDDRRYTLLFFIDKPSEKALGELKAYAERQGGEFISFGYAHPEFIRLSNYSHIDGDPFAFIRRIDKAQCVITDSFHACVFSAILHTKFYVFKRSYLHSQNQSDRLTNLLEQMHMQEYFDSSLHDASDERDFSIADRYFGEASENAYAYLSDVFQEKPHNKQVVKLFDTLADCCGCMACADVCPKDAIACAEQSDGAYYPRIDPMKCIGCGSCQQVCQSKTIEKIKTQNEAYIGFANNKVRVHSASGGIFASLAHKAIECGGVVFGAAMQMTADGYITCAHRCACSMEELIPILNSKYMQSNTDGIFKVVKKHLEDGTEVLFSGTSCQVAALKKYLHKEYTNLTTVDLICHGVPRTSMFRDYISYLEDEENAKIVDFSFRNRSDLKNPYEMTIWFSDHLNNRFVKKIRMRDSAYYRMFMARAGYRESCYVCRYATLDKPSDITLGDFYCSPESFGNYGIEYTEENTFWSTVITHTLRGKKCIQSCDTIDIQKADLMTVVHSHHNLEQPSRMDAVGERLLSIYEDEGYKGLQGYINKKNSQIDFVKKISMRDNRSCMGDRYRL